MEEFELEQLEGNDMVLNDAAFAIFGELEKEIDPTRSQSKTRRTAFNKVILPGQFDGSEPAHILCQHGLNRLMATPTAWHYNIERND